MGRLQTHFNNFWFRHLWLENGLRRSAEKSSSYGLSKARAEAIKSFVAKCGVDVDRVYAVGFAGTRRLSDDITEEKGAVNRRVEVHMMPYAPPGRL